MKGTMTLIVIEEVKTVLDRYRLVTALIGRAARIMITEGINTVLDRVACGEVREREYGRYGVATRFI